MSSRLTLTVSTLRPSGYVKACFKKKKTFGLEPLLYDPDQWVPFYILRKQGMGSCYYY